ncbi:hypothetical protein KJ596_03120 [Patescibacteria group bacterium]|nr:hypothetical protein [Patescibacteria group bacterium]MBU1868435.1 hypothetical protein [Patescibacteria group bacterium]
MSQVSSSRLRKDVEERVKEVFFRALADIKTPKQAEDFYNTFFTATEKINLPKRFGIFLTITRGTEYREIADSLKVSLPTVAAVQKQILIHGVKGMQKIIQQIIEEDKPNYEYDPDPRWARGKRYYRDKAIQKPHKHFPF